MPKVEIDTLDRKILQLLVSDARMPYLEVARACNVSGAAIHQRVQKLEQAGILQGSQFIISPSALGFNTCAYIGLYLREPTDWERVVEGLNEIPEVVEGHFTTGAFDMFIKIYARDNHHLLDIIHHKLQPLGVSRSETLMIFNDVISRQLRIADAVDE